MSAFQTVAKDTTTTSTTKSLFFLGLGYHLSPSPSPSAILLGSPQKSNKMADMTATPMGPEGMTVAMDGQTPATSVAVNAGEPGNVSDGVAAKGDGDDDEKAAEGGEEQTADADRAASPATSTTGIAAATVPTWNFSKITIADAATQAPAPILSTATIMCVVNIEPTGSECAPSTSANVDMGLPVLWTVDGTLATLDTPVDKFQNWADYAQMCQAGPHVVIRFREEYVETVELQTGSTTRAHERFHGFPVAKKLVAEQTDYFAGMFRAEHNWVENQTGVVNYDQNDPLGHPATFKALYQMLVAGGIVQPLGSGRNAVKLYTLAEMHHMADYLGCHRGTEWIQTWADQALLDQSDYWKVVTGRAHPVVAAHISATRAADVTDKDLQRSMVEDALAAQEFVLSHARWNYKPVFRASKIAEVLVRDSVKDLLDEQVKKGGLSASAMTHLFLMERRNNGQGN